MKSKKPTVVSLFAGCGGLDLGFKKAGFDIIWANDFDRDSVETYKNNVDKRIILGDITKIPNSEIPNNFDVLLGGFPCQGFSIANKNRSMKDERNFLYKEMLRIIKAKKPKIFVAENVKGLLSMEKGKIIEMIVKDFKKLGYKVDYKLLNAVNYGVPQNRQRVIIIGNRLGLKNEFPKQTHGEGLKKLVTVKEAVEHLADLQLSYKRQEHDGKVTQNHIARTNVHDTFWGRKHNVNQHEICDYLRHWRDKAGLTTKKVDDWFGYKYTAGHWFRKDNNSGSIPNPQDWWNLKKLLKFDDKFDKQVTEMELKPITFEQSLRINNWDTPSDTITATGPEIHPNRKRRMSVRECAVIQTFPDDFVFYGALGSMYKQIGNAVPVRLGNHIAKVIKKQLQKSIDD